MKILKIFGFVIGIHLFALILIFANPGCSSTSKPAPAPSDTVLQAEPPPTVNLPMTAADSSSSPVSSPRVSLNPDESAASSSSSSAGVRFIPTRPGSPAASTLVTAPVTDVTPATTYTVKSGDTLWDLGKKFHIPYALIAGANNLKTGVPLHAGQKLVIPGKTASVAAAPAAAKSENGAGKAVEKPRPAVANGNGVKHVVKGGETLGTIARTYNVKQGEIAVANNISDPQKIRAGMELIIPGWTGAGPKSLSKSSAKSPEVPVTPPAAAPPPPLFNLLDSPPSANRDEVPIMRVQDSPLMPSPNKK
ncbi:MAG: hypothetical protein RIQ93_2185 [Verrucomicrobiota bacterium]|jgi:LysM repeat protein